MLGRIICFSLLTLALSGSKGYTFEIIRSKETTQLIFKGNDLVKTRGEEHFESDWLVKDLYYRPACYLHTPHFSLPYQATLDVVIHYEARWRSLIEAVSDLSELSVARFDVAYDDTKGDAHRISHFLSVAELGQFEWLSKGKDFEQLRAHTPGIQTVHMPSMQVPAASTNIRVKMCAIGEHASIRVTGIELKLSKASHFTEALTNSVDSILKCFNTGLFLTNCRLEPIHLDAYGLAEMQYQLGVEYTCRGHELELVLASDSATKRIFPKAEKQETEVIGKGLTLKDLNPAKTRAATFDQGCFLKLNDLVKSVSERQKVEWAHAKAAVVAAIENAEVSARAFVDLNLLAQTMEALKVALEFENKFAALRTTHQVAPDLSLERLISKRQLEAIKRLLESRNIIEQSDSQYDRFKKLEEEARQKLKELECLLSE